MRSLWFIFLIGVTALQAAPNEHWKVVKTKDRGSVSGGAVLKSVTLKTASDRTHEVVITAVLFSESNYQLEVVDNPARDKTLAEVMQERGFVAGVNGGYFHPNGKPLGLLIAQGKMVHTQETAPHLLSGLIVATGTTSQLLRVGEKIPARAEEVLQAGPFLINHQAVVSGLESTRVARRTFVATDGHGLWMIGVISPVTLADAAQVLLIAAPKFFPKHSIKRALNLDGGSSSGLWANLSPEPFSQLEIKRVRNFVGIKNRNASR